METPGQRLSRQFWTVCLVILILAGLDAISHALAVGVVVTVIVWWLLLRVMRSVARSNQPRPRR